MPFRRRRLNISVVVNLLMHYVVLGLRISGRVHRASERCRQLSLMPKDYLIVLLRSIRLRKLKCGVEGRHRLNYRREWGRSFRSTLFRMGKCHVIQTNRLSFDAALPASLRIYRSVWSSSLLCWTELRVVSQRTSWIHRESAARPVFNRECSSPRANY